MREQLGKFVFADPILLGADKMKGSFIEPTLQLEARGSLELLAGGQEEHLVHVHLLQLADGEGDGSRECVGRNGTLIAFADVLGDIRLVTLSGSSVATATGEITVVRMW